MKQLTVVVVIRIANYSKRVTLLNSWMLPSTKIARAFTYLLSWQSLMGFVLWSCMQVCLETVLIAALKWEPRKDKWYVPPASLKEGEVFGETWPIPSIWNEFLPFPSSFFFFFLIYSNEPSIKLTGFPQINTCSKDAMHNGCIYTHTADGNGTPTPIGIHLLHLI